MDDIFRRLEEKINKMRVFEEVINEKLKVMELEENIPPFTHVKVQVKYTEGTKEFTLLTRRTLNKRMLKHYVDTVLEQERITDEIESWNLRLEEPVLTPEALLLIERTLKDPTVISLTDHYALHRGACSIHPGLLLIHVPFSVERWHIFKFSKPIEDHVSMHIMDWLKAWKGRLYIDATYDIEYRSLTLKFKKALEEKEVKMEEEVPEAPEVGDISLDDIKKFWSIYNYNKSA